MPRLGFWKRVCGIPYGEKKLSCSSGIILIWAALSFFQPFITSEPITFPQRVDALAG